MRTVVYMLLASASLAMTKSDVSRETMNIMANVAIMFTAIDLIDFIIKFFRGQ